MQLHELFPDLNEYCVYVYFEGRGTDGAWCQTHCDEHQGVKTPDFEEEWCPRDCIHSNANPWPDGRPTCVDPDCPLAVERNAAAFTPRGWTCWTHTTKTMLPEAWEDYEP